MADSTTTNYGYIKPDIGGSDNSWGEKLNSNFDLIDAQIKALNTTTTGIITSGTLLSAILALDGPGSGINADLLDGSHAAEFMLSADLLDGIKAVDGPGSGIDADLLDGTELAALMLKANSLSDVANVATARSNLALNEASNAEVWAGTDTTKPVTSNRLFGAAAPQVLTSAASIGLDLNAGINFTLTLAQNATLENPTNRKNGQSGVIVVTQDGTGSRTLAYGSHWKFPNGAPTLSTAAGAVDLISYVVISSTLVLGAWAGNLS